MDPAFFAQLRPGVTVKVTQQIPYAKHTWSGEVRGQVVSLEQKPTGAAFAHSRDGHLWLQRLVIRKPDGELMDLILDQYTRVDVEPPPPTPGQSAPPPRISPDAAPAAPAP